MTRLCLALTLLLANLGGPKVCCCLVSRVAVSGSTVVTKSDASPKVSTCCHAETCGLPVSTPKSSTPSSAPCPYTYACVSIDTLALPESPATTALPDCGAGVVTADFSVAYSLTPATAGFPLCVRHPLPTHTSGRDRLTAHCLLLC